MRLLGKIVGKPFTPQYDPPREGDIRDSQADIRPRCEILGYNPRVDFEEGLRRTYEWYRTSRTQLQVARQVSTLAEPTDALM